MTTSLAVWNSLLSLQPVNGDILSKRQRQIRRKTRRKIQRKIRRKIGRKIRRKIERKLDGKTDGKIEGKVVRKIVRKIVRKVERKIEREIDQKTESSILRKTIKKTIRQIFEEKYDNLKKIIRKKGGRLSNHKAQECNGLFEGDILYTPHLMEKVHQMQMKEESNGRSESPDEVLTSLKRQEILIRTFIIFLRAIIFLFQDRARRNALFKEEFLWSAGVVPFLFENGFREWGVSATMKALQDLEDRVGLSQSAPSKLIRNANLLFLSVEHRTFHASCRSSPVSCVTSLRFKTSYASFRVAQEASWMSQLAAESRQVCKKLKPVGLILIWSLPQVNEHGFCIKMLPITDDDNYMDHLRVIDSGICASYVGKMKMKSQELDLGLNCLYYPGIIQHEFMHALGIQHEQSR